MKHLKPFLEKFESYRLSGVVNYISKGDRKRFLDDLKRICGVLDYPMSDLSDSEFEYLRFKDAYELKDPVKEEDQDKCGKCMGTGQEKKPWGKEGNKGFHYRNVKCKNCEATGIKKKSDDKSNHIPIYLKFWFNTNGNYIGITKFTDKQLVPVIGKNPKISDWEKTGPVPSSQTKHLDIIYVQPNKRGDWVIGTVWINSRIFRYFIHNNVNFDGDKPYIDTIWTKYGKYSWYLDNHQVFILSAKAGTEESKSPDVFNCPVDSSLNILGVNSKEFLQDAEFSLILNLEKLKSSDYKKVAQIKQSRVDSKVGSLSHKKDDEIRKENIDKYISKLSSYDPSGSLNQIKSIIPRFFGWNHPIFFLYYGINSINISKIIHNLFIIHRKNISVSADWKESTDGEIPQIINEIKNLIVLSYKESSNRYPIIVENIQKCKKLARSENRKDILEFIDKYEDLNRSIIAYIGKDINKISDLESTERKIKTIQEILKSDRYVLNQAKGFINHLSTKEDPDPRKNSYVKIKQFLDTNGKDRLLEDMDIICGAIIH
jgi:hypothetical protein